MIDERADGQSAFRVKLLQKCVESVDDIYVCVRRIAAEALLILLVKEVVGDIVEQKPEIAYSDTVKLFNFTFQKLKVLVGGVTNAQAGGYTVINIDKILAPDIGKLFQLGKLGLGVKLTPFFALIRVILRGVIICILVSKLHVEP